MAQVANTLDTYDVGSGGGIREELHDVISNITPSKTPFLSLIKKGKCKTTNPNWLQDSLPTPSGSNKYVQGDEFSYDAITPPSRVGNYTQIARKAVVISRTLDKSDKAGRKREIAYQIMKEGQALKTDMERGLLSNQASLAGNASTAPQCGGLAAWLETNVSRGATGADGGYNSGTGVVDAATDGTQRAFTKSLLDDMIEDTYNNGGDGANILMVSPYNKRVFSTFMSDSNVAAFRTSMSGKKQGTIYGAADVYISDFGDITVMPNVQMQRSGATVARNIFLLDKDKLEIQYFDPIHSITPAKTGDNEKRVLLTEYTLKVDNEAAHGQIADTFGLTAST